MFWLAALGISLGWPLLPRGAVPSWAMSMPRDWQWPLARQLGIAMRDMLEAGQRYPLIAWSAQFERIRRDLSDAVAQEQAAAAPGPASSQRQYLASALEQFWASVDRMFGLAGAGE